MPTICIHCALVALAEGRTDPWPVFDETPEQHMQRVHPGGVDPVERAEIERRAAEALARMREENK